MISAIQIAPIAARNFTSHIASLISVSPSSIIVPDSVSKAVDIAGRNHWQSLRHAYFVWLLICTVAVAVGVVLEEIKLRVMGGVDPATGFRRPRPIISVIARRIATVGWILIVVGVIGEGAFEAFVAGADSHLQEITDRALGTAITQVGTLEKQAEGLRKEAEDERTARATLEAAVEWRSLSKHQQELLGTRLLRFSDPNCLVVFLTNDLEASSFADDIVAALLRAKWKVPEPLEMFLMRQGPSPVGTHKPLGKGMDVVSTGDSISREAAAVFIDELNKMGFDAAKSPVLDKNPVPRIEIWVYHRPKGPQGEARLRAEAEAKKKQQASSQTKKP